MTTDSQYNSSNIARQAVSIPPAPISAISVQGNQDNRQGIIEVVFALDPSVMSWIANTFWDGKIYKNKDGKSTMVPNSEYYRCPICQAIKSAASNIVALYQECRGTKDHPHEPHLTDPIDWHPIGSRTGVSFLCGQLVANINPNVQTGNYGKNSMDITNKADLDSRFMKLATKHAEGITAGFLSNKDNFAAELMADKSYVMLPQVFNVPFLTTMITNLAINLSASFTKAKGMEAVAKIVENRAHIEQEIMNRSERDVTEQQFNRGQGILGGLFSFGQKPPNK